MSDEGDNNVEAMVKLAEDDNELLGVKDKSSGNLVEENGLHDRNEYTVFSHDQLEEAVVELSFQNEYLKSQFVDMKNLLNNSGQPDQQNKAMDLEHSASDGAVRELHGKIELLERDLLEERQTRHAAEEALKHLGAAHSEADTKAQEFAAKLAEAQQKMDQEIKERDEKYSELDTKFNRLHKRAKQRIQEVQKEKEDIEMQFREVNEKADLASAQLSALQQELERTRQHANEALKAMDVERQQLRSANNKLRDTIEELRRSLVPKENALETLQQSISEKEQMLEDMRVLLQAADEKRQSSIAELSLKHQKQVEDMQTQIADALNDQSKATETISSLRALVAERESKIAEMDAASSGEAARLRAALETLKGELSHLKNEHEKERESWKVASQSMRMKLEAAESARVRAEVEVAKMRSQLESELSVQTQRLNTRDAELEAAKEKINRIESDFSSYKVRAHALLQKKDAELAAAMDNEQLKAHEETLKEAEKEILLVSAERDKALQDVKNVLTNHEKEIAERDTTLSDAKQQIKNLEMRLSSALSAHQSAKEMWETNLQNVEETWRLRCEALKAQNEVSTSQDLQNEVDKLNLHCKKLKEEQDSFRDLADRMIEEKDREISRLVDDSKNLRQLLDSRPPVDYSNNQSDFQKPDASNSSALAAEQQILILARQQAQREEELAQSQRHILALQEEIEELEHENRLHSQQEAILKEELRNMERMQKREGVDLTYLKNVILKLLETGEVERLLPVVAMLLQFSPEEVQKCQQAYRATTEVAPSSATHSSGTSQSLFSRFAFS